MSDEVTRRGAGVAGVSCGKNSGVDELVMGFLGAGVQGSGSALTTGQRGGDTVVFDLFHQLDPDESCSPIDSQAS